MHRDDNPRASSSASIPTPSVLNDGIVQQVEALLAAGKKPSEINVQRDFTPAQQRQLDDLIAYYDDMFAKHGAKSAPTSAVDWRLLVVMSPTLLLWLAWGVWLAFVVIPTLFGLHYAAYVPSGNNLAFCGIGLTELLAAQQSANMGQIGRSVLFSSSVCLLAYWF